MEFHTISIRNRNIKNLNLKKPTDTEHQENKLRKAFDALNVQTIGVHDSSGRPGLLK